MRSIQKWLPTLLIQSVMIVLSVLVALAVNQWQESRGRAARAVEVRVAFATEIRANRDLLLSELCLPHHRRLKAEYDKAAQGEAPDPGSFFETGVHPALFRDAAWRSFSTSGVLADLPPHLVLAFTDIYHA